MDLPHSSVGKESAYSAGDPGSIPGLGEPLEKEMSTHFSILTWRIPWIGEPARLQSMGLQSWTRLSNYAHTQAEVRGQTEPV